MSFRLLRPWRASPRVPFTAALWFVGAALGVGCGGYARPANGDEGHTPANTTPDDVGGGQSGGQTSGQGSAPRPCACVREDAHFVRARITRLEGGCVELEVIEPLVSTTHLVAGDVFGGVALPLCWNDAPLISAVEVLASFVPGQQAGSECAGYRACALERCGDVEDAYSRSIDPDCAARQNAGEPVDCQQIETVDEAALLAWDMCDGACATETSAACAAHASEAQLGGVVQMGALAGDQLTFYWAGETRSQSLAELSAPGCESRHADIFQEYLERRLRERSESGVTSAPTEPPPETSMPLCPLP